MRSVRIGNIDQRVVRSQARSAKRAGAAAVALTLTGCGVVIPDAHLRPGSRAFARDVDAALSRNANALEKAPCTASDSEPKSESGNKPETAATRNADMAALATPTWRSGDVGVTTKLSDGRVLWVFGDTVRAKGTSPRVVSNSMLISEGRCFSEVRTPSGGPMIGNVGSGRVCWPNSALTIPMGARDLVLVGCSRIQQGKDGLYDFTYRGMTLAMFAVAKGKAPVLVHTTSVTGDSTDAERINWGSAMVADDQWVYVFGSQQPKGSAGKGAYVARARLASIASHDTWQFWNGHSYGSDAQDAAPVLLASEGVSQTFSVVPWKGKFLLVSKQGGEFGGHIGIWSASRPEGPWSGYRAVPQPYSLGGGVVAYQPLAHPELPTPSGDLLVSLSRNTEKFTDLIADPRKGRPMFVEVPAP